MAKENQAPAPVEFAVTHLDDETVCIVATRGEISARSEPYKPAGAHDRAQDQAQRRLEAIEAAYASTT